MNGSRDLIQTISLPNTTSADVVIAVPSVYLGMMKEAMAGTTVQIAAQNIHQAPSGAYTGEISAAMLVDIGVGWTIIGHSERRQYFCETNAMVGDKLKMANSHELSSIVCIGESLGDRETGTPSRS